MAKITLFNTPDAMKRMGEAAAILMADTNNVKLYRLGQMLRIILSNADDFDENCQVNIEWIGSNFLNYIQQIQDINNPKLDMVMALTYRIFVEYDASVKHEVSMEIRSFLNGVLDITSTLSDEARVQIEYARQEMPIAILKRILNSDELGNLRNVSSIAHTIEKKIEEWQQGLAKSEEKATRLGEVLEKNTQAFNFVGLHDGFSDLSKHIIRELRFSQAGIAVFGLLVLFPSGVDLWMALIKGLDFSKINQYTLVAASVGTVTMTLLFLYFFRIALRKADSCTAQLMQVRLRMSLCRFIQSYADYSTEIKEKNADALDKFEALIFSGIVGAEDKLPSTFDGLEQLSALAKSIRGSKD
jgi:hypothetical protein